jgi:hypothetical protein
VIKLLIQATTIAVGGIRWVGGAASPIFDVPSTRCKQLGSDWLSALRVRLQETGNMRVFAIESHWRHDHANTFVAEIEKMGSGLSQSALRRQP